MTGRFRRILAAGVAVLAPVLGLATAMPVLAADWTWSLPGHVPEPRVPADNPMSAVKVELGRRLFYDTRLSGNGTIACASCHIQAKAFTDGRALSPGSTGGLTHRNAQPLANSAWNATYTWANPALVSLERQMEVPLFGDDPVEMGVTDANRAAILERLRADPVYPPLFRQSFPDEAEPLTMATVIKAIAAFQRGIVSVDSRYDRYLQGKASLSEAETRGMALFFGERAECHHCHGSFNFNDQVVHARSREVETPFHNTGLYNLDGAGAYPFPNRGLFEFTAKPEDMGAFRAPSLRNVAVTGPYMHDGGIATLAAVIDAYSDGGRAVRSGPLKGDGRLNPHKSGLISRIGLTPQEKRDLLAFLGALTDETLLTDPRWSDPWKK
ncbi:methylamine utilization protein [Azospirillum sp. B510]|uniref:methanobactin export MATE transporter MbnM n=2 Tax=Alphaproteobacteria TaxID=28211 RepID=UPI0001C4C2CF|nr:methanobactin export MATE transporter MbnM [Azospirillum sp. B510]BAI71431.1 methylamine utilization protein [Azospirillum sp. B510]